MMKLTFSAVLSFAIAAQLHAQSCQTFRFQFLSLQQGFTAFVASPNELRVQIK
jgi:hypothetical protein